MPIRACTVSFEERGVRHEAKVDAETAYEAAVYALKQWSTSRYMKGPHRHAVIQVDVQAPRRVTMKMSAILEWLYSTPGRTPEEMERKKRLRLLLADDRH